jgi:predicted transcriptional regulator
MAGGRVGEAGRAERVNAAASLLASGMAPAEAARVVAQQFSVSARQAHRYVEAAAAGPVEVPEPSVVFTVKLPASLAARVRQHAHERGVTISAVVTRALTEFLRRAHRGRRSR